MMKTLIEMIDKGGVYPDIVGDTPDEVYKNLLEQVDLPIDKNIVLQALTEREELMSTSIGLGIALSHPRVPIMKTPEDDRIFIVYPKTPLDMKALDGQRVHTVFIILSHSLKVHLSVLNLLSILFRDDAFIRVLKTHLDKKTFFNEMDLAMKRLEERTKIEAPEEPINLVQNNEVPPVS